MNNNNQTEQKLAGSLTAKTTELIPFLPYLLQDIWELGSNPNTMTQLIKNNVSDCHQMKLVDLGCGKGAVSIAVCKALDIQVQGIDLIPEFIEIATIKAKEYEVSSSCHFIVQDINESVMSGEKYDIAILGAVGDVLGNPKETLTKLKNTIHNNGYILIDEAYLVGDSNNVKYQNYEYLTLNQWKQLFQSLDLELIAEIPEDLTKMDAINQYNNEMIRKRADELIIKYPEKEELFNGYVKSQQDECDDLDNTIVGVTWLLKRI